MTDPRIAAKSRPRPDDDAPHLLIVDDDSRIRNLLSRYLGENGFRVTTAESAMDARSLMTGLAYDLIVLDVMMPGESGLDFAKDLRAQSDLPILMLTARSEPADRIAGLEIGVDDYLPKPFEPRELLLRINNILRHGHLADMQADQPTHVTFGPFSFHLERRELRQGDEILRLTDKERELLTTFALAAGETVPRLSLIDESSSSERAVDVQINRLRRKLEVDSSNPMYLQTVRGIGYRLMVDA